MSSEPSDTEEEIVVTPEMIAAGEAAVEYFCDGADLDRDAYVVTSAVRSIYIAMARLKPRLKLTPFAPRPLNLSHPGDSPPWAR